MGSWPKHMRILDMSETVLGTDMSIRLFGLATQDISVSNVSGYRICSKISKDIIMSKKFDSKANVSDSILAF